MLNRILRRLPVVALVLAAFGSLPVAARVPRSAVPLSPRALVSRPAAAYPAVAPSATPAVTPTSPAAARASNLAGYRPALRPEFASDLQAVAQATRYSIQVTLHPGASPTLTGLERVHYTNTHSATLNEVDFRLFPNLPGYGGSMTVGAVALGNAVANTRLISQNSALRVLLNTPLPRGASIDLTLPFTDTLPSDNKNGYAVFSYVDGVYALAGFYPIIPVYDQNGWHVEVSPTYGDVTFTEVALYDVSLTVPADLVAVTTGRVVKMADNPDGTRTWRAVAAPVRDFYVALSADFRVVSQTWEDVQVNSYYRSAQAESGQLALQYAISALNFYSQQFGAYPYAVYDIAATPTTAGGIEYPGVIVVAEQLYASPDDYFQFVLAHETAHQWWYGLVGSDQVNDPWQDEALVNYCAYYYFDKVVGADRAAALKNRLFDEPYRNALREGRDRPVAGAVASFDAADYGTIVYGKGPLFFDAVRARLGDAAFIAGLRDYLREHRYGVAYPADLIDAFENASGQWTGDLYQFWIEGKTQ